MWIGACMRGFRQPTTSITKKLKHCSVLTTFIRNPAPFKELSIRQPFKLKAILIALNSPCQPNLARLFDTAKLTHRSFIPVAWKLGFAKHSGTIVY
jgi:hypothetical protein